MMKTKLLQTRVDKLIVRPKVSNDGRISQFSLCFLTVNCNKSKVNKRIAKQQQKLQKKIGGKITVAIRKYIPPTKIKPKTKFS